MGLGGFPSSSCGLIVGHMSDTCRTACRFSNLRRLTLVRAETLGVAENTLVRRNIVVGQRVGRRNPLNAKAASDSPTCPTKIEYQGKETARVGSRVSRGFALGSRKSE